MDLLVSERRILLELLINVKYMHLNNMPKWVILSATLHEILLLEDTKFLLPLRCRCCKKNIAISNHGSTWVYWYHLSFNICIFVDIIWGDEHNVILLNAMLKCSNIHWASSYLKFVAILIQCSLDAVFIILNWDFQKPIHCY